MVDQTKISGFAAASRQWTANEQNILRNLPTDKATMIPWRAGIAPMSAQVAQTTPTSIFTAPTPAVPVVTPAAVATATSETTSTVARVVKNGKKFDVMVGDKVVRSCHTQHAADYYLKTRAADHLRSMAPLGDVTKATTATNTTQQVAAATQQAASKPKIIFHDILAKEAEKAQKAQQAAADAQKLTKEQRWANVAKLRAENLKGNKFGGIVADQEAARIIAENNVKKAAEAQKKVADFTKPMYDDMVKTAKDVAAKTPKIVDKTDDAAKVAKKFNWSKLGKLGKYVGIAAVAGLLVGAGILIGKAIQKNKAEKAEEVEPTPVVPVPVPENEEENVTPVDPTPAPVDPFLPLNPDGTYTTQKGDSFWKIAERNLKDKFRNEPEKFENLPEQEKNAKIQLETRRIMKLNGYTLAEDKWHSAPTLYPNVNIKINEVINVEA